MIIKIIVSVFEEMKVVILIQTLLIVMVMDIKFVKQESDLIDFQKSVINLVADMDKKELLV